jgi:AraC-like DNA-binding protein
MKQKNTVAAMCAAEKERFLWDDWNGLYGVHILHYVNGFAWPSQYHDELEIVSIPPGLSGNLLINGELHPVDKGCFFVISPGMIHSFDMRFTGRKSFVVMLIKTRKLITMLSGFPGCSRETIRDALHRLPVSLPAEAYALHQRLCGLSKVRELEAGHPFNEPPLKNAAQDMEILFGVFARLLASAGKSDHKSPPTAVYKAIDILEKIGTEPIGLDAIARECFVSKFHLSKIFKKHTGMTIWEYRSFLRIRKAKQLLWIEDKNVTDVCYACGFTDPSYFIKIFRRATGCTPKQWMKKGASG